MESLDQARSDRAQRIRDAQQSVELLAKFVRMHADAVDGLDRSQLHEIGDGLDTWRALLSAAGADGASASAIAPGRLIDAVEAVAAAGRQALQILGGRLARPEPWGGPFPDDHGLEDDSINDHLE